MMIAASIYESVPALPERGGPVLSTSQSGNELTIYLCEEADRSLSVICLDGKVLDGNQATLEEGKHVLSYEICDISGTVLESAEQAVVIDTTPPVIETVESPFYPEGECTIPLGVFDESETSLSVWVDGVLQEEGDLTICPENKTLRILAKDEKGNASEKLIQIGRKVKVTGDFGNPGNIELESDTYSIRLDGDWKGASLTIQYPSVQSVIPFASEVLEGQLVEDQAVFILNHPSLDQPLIWNVSRKVQEVPVIEEPAPKAEPSAVETLSVLQEEPKEQTVIPYGSVKGTEAIKEEPAVQTVQNTIVSSVSKEEPAAPAEKVSVPSAVTEKEPFPEVLSESIVPAENKIQPAAEETPAKESVLQPVLTKGTSSITLKKSQYISHPETYELEGGDSMKITSMETNREYSTIAQAMEEEYMPRMEITSEDNESYVIIPTQGSQKLSSSLLDGTDARFWLDEEGQIQWSVQSQPAVRPCVGSQDADLSSTVWNEPLRLYLPEEAENPVLYVEGHPVKTTVQSDSLSQSYVDCPVLYGSYTYELKDGNQSLFQETLTNKPLGPWAFLLPGSAGLLWSMGMFWMRRRYL